MSASDPVGAFARLPEPQREGILRSLTIDQRRELNERWSAWGHAGQIEPPGDWRIWLIRAGRGFGKTRAGAEWVSELARRHPKASIALVGATAADARRVMIEGPSGLLGVARDDERVRFRRTNGEVTFASGATGFVYSAETPDALRGPEHDFAWCDELAKWRRGEATWHNLMMGLRGGAQPRVLVTTTPRPTALMRRVRGLEGVVETLGRTRDNPHLPASFVAAMTAEYGGTRLGRQELDGELIGEAEGALWSRDMIEGCRVSATPPTARLVIGVDPPASAQGDACGIVAVALGRDGRAYVIEDASIERPSPERWARAVAGAAARHGADRVIAEANNGGDMVRSVLMAAAGGLPVRLVHASRGKAARAEPVAALYEGGRVSHVGTHPTLEDELCGLVVGGAYEGPGRSPDRADALVWALTELMLAGRREPSVRVI